jgi:hypothetical protein
MPHSYAANFAPVGRLRGAARADVTSDPAPKSTPSIKSSSIGKYWSPDIERHEVFLNREGVQNPLHQSVAAGW